MVRMLGFSDEDKQRIGLAQQGAGKGVVRGVLGLPGRLVGGILGGSPAEGAANMASDNQVQVELHASILVSVLSPNKEKFIFVTIVCLSSSPLQICGLIFFSRKMKRERGENPWMIPAEARKSHSKAPKVRVLVHTCKTIEQVQWILTLLLVSREQICPQATTQVTFPSTVIFGSLNIQIPSSQLYL